MLLEYTVIVVITAFCVLSRRESNDQAKAGVVLV